MLQIRCAQSPLQGQGVRASKVTLKKFTTQQNEHHIVPLTHIPKCRKRASNTMRAVTPSGAGGAREQGDTEKIYNTTKRTTHRTANP